MSEVKTVGKHTPGEWKIRGDKYVPVQIREGSMMYVLEDMDGHNIGFICSWKNNPKALKSAKANANLISAAPDLLEALEFLFDDYKQLADSGDAGFWKIEDTEAGRRAMAAIAKARGVAK